MKSPLHNPLLRIANFQIFAALVIKVAVEVSSLCAIYHNPNYRNDNLLDAVGVGEEEFFCENKLAKNFVVIKQFSTFGKQ